jgi:3-hydroxybutyryl-CoA dehydrogenase
MTDMPDTIGVLGAGTMGSGIAQLACIAGARTLLHDPIPEALQKGIGSIHGHIDRAVERGRMSQDEAEAAKARLHAAGELAELSPAGLVIEAAPESLELKQQMFTTLADGIVGTDCVLATNTSSLLVTAIAAAVPHPERVVGMHFFNPAPLMRLLEVVAGPESAQTALHTARVTGEAMGKIVIDAVDGPGFLVNRCNRPFGLEALKLLQERVADVPTIDRIARLQGGFRMGPFELMDLVGVDLGLDVSRSFYEQSFYEPRWRPSMITARTVAAGHHGRKSGRGYYDYSNGTDAYRERDPEPLDPTPGDGVLVIAGDSVVAEQLSDAAEAVGWDVRTPETAGGDIPFLVVDCTLGDEPPAPLEGGPQAILCAAGSLTGLDPGGGAVGFHVLPPLDSAQLVELTRGPETSESAASAAKRVFATLGKHTVWVADAPGLALGRMLCQVINECAFALGEGVGSAADIDAGMIHGLNYPRGPLAWADEIGLDHVLMVLDALYEERREERYRTAPALRELGLSGRLGRQTGRGFFEYGNDPA